MEANRSQHSNGAAATAAAAAMQSMPDASLMTYMGVPGTEAEVAAMDDLQFMDALLDNDDATFGDTAEPGNPMTATTTSACTTATPGMNVSQQQPQQQLHPVSVSETSSLASSKCQVPSPAEKQQQQQQQQAQQSHQQHTQQQQQQQQPPITMQQQTTKPDASNIMTSPLSARLNYPFVPTAAAAAAAPNNVAFSPPGQLNHLKAAAAAPTAITTTSTSRLHAEGRSSHSSMTFPDHTTNRKRARDHEGAPPVSEDDGDKQKRRMDRNQREQQRSHKITEQISYLRDLLADANVHFKPDKHSTLISVVEYIRQLQSRSQLLDAEHKKLLETISKTNEAVNSPYYQTTPDGQTVPGSNDLLVDAPASLVLEEEHAVFVKGLDYQNVFKQCSIALAVASIDGRFMDCNSEFEALTGYERDELLPGEKTTTPESSSPSLLMVADSVPSSSDAGVPSTVMTAPKRNLSLFNLLGREDMENVFRSMSRMLKQPVALGNHHRLRDQEPVSSSTTQVDFWSGYVAPSRRIDSRVRMNVTLVRSPQGRPKFFQCALTTEEEEPTTTTSQVITRHNMGGALSHHERDP